MSDAPETASEVDLDLPEHEKEEVIKRIRPRAAVLHETIRAEGEVELHRPSAALAWSGLAAGLSMGFSLVAMGVLRSSLPDAPWRKLIQSVGYTVGFVIVIVARQQLFTENTLTPVLPLLHNRDRDTLGRVLKLWAILLVTNLIGALAFATVLAHTRLFDDGTRDAFLAIGKEALEGGVGSHFIRAIFSGWLIALMVWMLPSIEGTGMAIVAGVSYLIGVADFSHVIAGSVETLYVVSAGAAPIGVWITQFFLPVLFGNVLGGVALVAAIGHAQVRPQQAS